MKTYTVKTATRDKSRVRRDHPRCHTAIWICMCGHTPTQLHIRRFIEIPSGVSEPGGSKFALFPYFGYWLLQQCKPW